jgi:hypothetical protein
VLGLLIVSGIPLVLGAPTGSAPTPVLRSSPAPPPTPALPTDTVSITDQRTGNLSQFWGAGVEPPASLANATAEVQGTPLGWYEWPAGQLADFYNMTTGQLWWYGKAYAYGPNESQFVQWCESIACHAILAVPGEIDNLSTVLWDVRYTVDVLHFQPAYWEIGCEPYSWTHLGISWPNWTTSNDVHVNATSYAELVHSFIPPMKTVDPSMKFIGLPGVGAGPRPDTPWLNATVDLNGPNISAISIHDYPAESGPVGGTLAGFMQTLVGATSVSARITTDEQAIRAACPTCKHAIRFFVSEFGSGTSSGGSWQPFMQTYPEVPFITGELILMMDSNVTNADMYDLSSVYNGSLFNLTGVPRALDSLYTQILPHFDSLRVSSNSTGAVGGVFASAAESLQNHSLTVLAVNTNTTQSVDLKIAGQLFPSDGSYSVWRADNSTTSPDGTYLNGSGFGNASNWVLPPLGVLLVSVCLPSSASSGPGRYEVTFCESGLPAGTRWSVTIGGHTYSRGSTTISFPEPNGTYAFRVNLVKGWLGSVRYGSLLVNGTPASVITSWTSVPVSRPLGGHGGPVAGIEPAAVVAGPDGSGRVRDPRGTGGVHREGPVPLATMGPRRSSRAAPAPRSHPR